MSDDDELWRHKGDDELEEEWDDFGELSFADDPRPEGAPIEDEAPPLRFGSDDTGGLPHWTEPPTGELPKLFADREPTDDLDVWSTISQQAPVWQDEKNPDHTTMVDELAFDDVERVPANGDEVLDDSLFELSEPDADLDIVPVEPEPRSHPRADSHRDRSHRR